MKVKERNGKIKNAIENFEYNTSGKRNLNGGYAQVNKMRVNHDKKAKAFIVTTETEIGDCFDCDCPRREIFTNCRYILDDEDFHLLRDKEVEERGLE